MYQLRIIDIYQRFHSAGEVNHFRYNNYDRGLGHLTPSQTKEFYRSWHSLTTLLRDANNEVEVLLTPGNTIIIDNERYVHQVIDCFGCFHDLLDLFPLSRA